MKWRKRGERIRSSCYAFKVPNHSAHLVVIEDKPIRSLSQQGANQGEDAE